MLQNSSSAAVVIGTLRVRILDQQDSYGLTLEEWIQAYAIISII